MTKKSSKPPVENLGVISVLNGQGQASMIRELDPNGAIVVHSLRKGAYAHERMHQNGMIDDDMLKAGERFRRDFERGHLRGHFAKLDMFRTSSGRHENLTESILNARAGAMSALSYLGIKRNGSASLSASCLWHVVGEGVRLEDWVQRISWTGRAMDTRYASGLLIASLERLALHYGYIAAQEIKERSISRGFKDGINAAIAFVNLSATGDKTHVGSALRKIAADLSKRYSRVKV